MRPPRADIAAPELSARIRWIGDAPESMAAACANGPALVHFFDFAQLNSVRALPYVLSWQQRYGNAGLTVLGVHSPRFPCTADRDAVAASLERLGVIHPVALDFDYALWHDYGCEGWPSLFLWARGGALDYFHFGEGEYTPTEEGIQELLRAEEPLSELPPPLEPLRATDAPGALVAPPSPEVFPGGSAAEPWDAAGEAELELDYAAGGAYATADGSGELAVRIDDGAERTVPIAGPALIELASHPGHERHRLRLEGSGEVRIWAISFAAGMPG